MRYSFFLFTLLVCLPLRAWHDRLWSLPSTPSPLEQQRIEEEVNYLLGSKTHLERTLGRARPMLRLIEEELHRRHLPSWLLLVPLVESSYRLDVISHAGAAGPWQLMPETARRFGIPVEASFDGRYSLPLATRGALDYLTWLKDTFDGEWLLALAAYNAGEGRLKASLTAGAGGSVQQLPLPAETRRYVARLQALGRLLSAPERYGLRLPPWQEGGELRVDYPAVCSLTGWSQRHRQDLQGLLPLNPAWRSWEPAMRPPCPVLYGEASLVTTTRKRLTVTLPVSLEGLADPLQFGTARGLDMERREWPQEALKDPLGLRERRPHWWQ
ncbi:membrane bound lytic murein transglycosylase D [Aeromonas diversa CDC 2478-85]|uniref:Membrane bound lytic murein transglycosylase D n=1 Tax=Aeromonas diversa CDC 2478-85 TaxID=1268237 RepID=N9U0Y0_9GAMM|nr:lytic transglycosylase domain-containing protein [Aeromonas diversa]ENY72039.1 membrane bound lytic murein transglycosylase D [Aeromonas diversa CDC 2478-85]